MNIFNTMPPTRASSLISDKSPYSACFIVGKLFKRFTKASLTLQLPVYQCVFCTYIQAKTKKNKPSNKLEQLYFLLTRFPFTIVYLIELLQRHNKPVHQESFKQYLEYMDIFNKISIIINSACQQKPLNTHAANWAFYKILPDAPYYFICSTH